MGIIQVKAEPFGPAKIGPEMASKGVLHPTITALTPQRGTYLIVSTRDDPAAPGKRKRVAAMEQVLSDHGLAGQIHVDFLGAREVADWVEQSPARRLAPSSNWRSASWLEKLWTLGLP